VIHPSCADGHRASTEGSDGPIGRRFVRLSSDIRYVAVYNHGELSLRQRPNLSLATASETDRYEELLVNPTLLTLTRQRGDIDCGGLNYVVIRYSNFFQFVAPIEGGHVSVAFEPYTDPI
jgi:hypothetical protein